MIPDTPPPRPPATRAAERFIPARNGTSDTKGPTLDQVVQTIRTECAKIKEATERATTMSTPPDGATIRLRSDSKAIRRLRQLRDERTPPRGTRAP